MKIECHEILRADNAPEWVIRHGYIEWDESDDQYDRWVIDVLRAENLQKQNENHEL